MGPLRDDTARAARAAEIVRALAHPDRLRVAAALCAGEVGAGELAARLGLTRSQVTRHLAPLLAARLVAASPGAGEPRFRVAEPALHGLVACMEDCSR
jgi:DNA-binding transcriptional ArsR family regulator